MTTLINSESKVLNYTNEFIEAVLLQLNPSNNYYTTGGDDVLFIKIGSNEILILDYTYHMNKYFQNYTTNENLINIYDSECISNGTSNGYDLQSVYNGDGFLGTRNDLSQVYLTMYDTTVSPYTDTGSENINVTDIQISLNFSIKVNGGTVLHPRMYDGAVFEMIPGTDSFAFRQNTIHGGQPIAQFYSPAKKCTFHGDCQIPNMYNKTHVDTLIANIYNDTYIKTKIDTLIPKIDSSSYYTKTEIDIVFKYRFTQLFY